MSETLKTWSVRYERTCCGTTFVKAETAESAVAIVESGVVDPDPCEKMIDWETIGDARLED